MLYRKYSGITFVLLLLLSVSLYAQDVVKLIPYNGTAGSYFMAQIKADTAANHGIPANRVYELQRGGIYLNTEVFNVPAGSTLRLTASTGTERRPVIFQYPTGTGTSPQNPPGNLFVLQGGSLNMKNIIVSGYFEPVDSNFNNVQGGLINTTQVGSSIYIDSCILTNINGQHVRTGSATFTIQVTNSIFANMGALSRSNFGAGKGFDLREASCDSLILVNNTFVNYQDRVVRHYNFSNPAAGTGGIGYCIIDHNSFINGMGFHGLLSMGNVGSPVIITNNLFQDAFAAGEDSADATRTFEWANTGEKYPNGNNRMSWIFGAPNDTTDWIIKNNYYSISDSGQAFLNTYNLTENTPLSWNINTRLGADSVTAFTKENITLKNIPMLMTDLMRWYRSPNGGNMTKNTPSSLWNRATDDMDRRGYKFYSDSMDASYSTSLAAYTAADGGYPVGDLNWFPAKHAQWIQNPTAVEKYNSNVVVSDYQLEQNYPNPFNPSTIISYALPKASIVSLTIYNALGQEVMSLVNNESQASGKYNVTWNGKDSFGKTLSSGIYFYQLRTNNQTLSKKMMLLK